MTEVKTVEKGNTIKVEYTGTLDDGTVFDASEKHGQLLEFEVGSGQLIKGFDDAVLGMKIGQEKKVVINAENAYGQHNPQLMKEIPSEQLPQTQKPEVGMTLIINLPNGAKFPATIAKVAAKTITLDLNHPLAGKTLTFKIKVAEIVA